MLQGNKIVVVMPAYNAARTLRQTYDEVIAHDIVDEIILVDDASRDETAAIARTLDRGALKFTLEIAVTAVTRKPVTASPSPPELTSSSCFIPIINTRRR